MATKTKAAKAPKIKVNDQVRWQGVYGKVAGENEDHLMGTRVERTGTVRIIANAGVAVVQVNGDGDKVGTTTDSLTRLTPPTKKSAK
jgi:hypothetical protein